MLYRVALCTGLASVYYCTKNYIFPLPQTEALLNARAEEEMNTLLDISVYDVVRNETARKHRQELEQRLAEEEKIRKEKEKDYLAPFLARIGDPEVLDRDQMVDVAQVMYLFSELSELTH